MAYKLVLALQNEQLLTPAVAAEFEQIIAGLQTQFVDQLADISNPPRAKVFVGTAQAIVTGTDTMATFVPARADNMEEFDSHSMYELASKAFVISQPGLYMMSAFIVWDVNAVGSRTLTFKQINGIVEMTSRQPANAANNYHLHIVPLQVSQAQVDTGAVKFGVQVFQSSGGNLNVTTNSWFSIYRVAKL